MLVEKQDEIDINNYQSISFYTNELVNNQTMLVQLVRCGLD